MYQQKIADLRKQLIDAQNLDAAKHSATHLAALQSAVIPRLTTYPSATPMNPADWKTKYEEPINVIRKITTLTQVMSLLNDILKDHPELIEEYPEQFARFVENI